MYKQKRIDLVRAFLIGPLCNSRREKISYWQLGVPRRDRLAECTVRVTLSGPQRPGVYQPDIVENAQKLFENPDTLCGVFGLYSPSGKGKEG